MFNRVINVALAVENQTSIRSFYSHLGVSIMCGPADLICDSYTLFRITAEYEGKVFSNNLFSQRIMRLLQLSRNREWDLPKRKWVFFINVATVATFDTGKNLNRVEFK